MQARYRIGQFLQGFTATVTQDELEEAAEILRPDAFELFLRMPRDAQRHSLNVLESVCRAGHQDDDLAVAALLHDVGKLEAAATLPINLWTRGPLTLLEVLAPALLRKIAVSNPAQGWRYSLHVHLEHPQIGAAMARRAGCSEVSCWLIARHQDESPARQAKQAAQMGYRETLLQALQAADRSN